MNNSYLELICRIIGHKKPLRYYENQGIDLRIGPATKDGIDRDHREISFICDRCKKNIRIGVVIDGMPK